MRIAIVGSRQAPENIASLILSYLPRQTSEIVSGGAKGVADIKALKVIEEAGIPIDYIVGTSIGSIVGGLYAIGYTAEQQHSMVRQQD